jgi:dihydroorotase
MKKTYFFLCCLLFAATMNGRAQPSPSVASKPYKYIIKGGHVIDPKNNIDGVMDIAISQPSDSGAMDSKIALVAPSIDPNLAVQLIDAKGLYVTPGIVDIHVHVFVGTDADMMYRNGPLGLDPDVFTFRTGITTVADAGSSGWRSFELFKKQVIDRSQTRVLAFLNIVGEGMAGPRFESNLEDMDAQKTAAMAKKYPEIVVGVKNAHFGRGVSGIAENAYLIPIERGIAAAKDFGGYLMLDGQLNEEVMKRFRPGDIYTHIFSRAIMADSGHVKPYILAAQKRGVIFDLGFGRSSFRFSMAIPAFKAGFYPNSVSSDMHTASMNNAMKDMPNIMGMLLAMGMDFRTIIQKCTWNPAQEINRKELGNLSVGSIADIAIFQIRTGRFGFYDSAGERIEGTQRVEAEMTIRGGDVVYNLNGLLRPGPQIPSRPANNPTVPHSK